jgi:3-dehydroquinate synthase
MVLADLDTLQTLPPRELRTGLAEVIKYGIFWDREFFAYLESNLPDVLALDRAVLAEVVTRSCAIKALVVGHDETEKGMRALLNFGHTIGHAVETVTGYATYTHGEAVAVGMAAASEIAVNLGMLPASDLDRILALLTAAGLPAELPAGLEKKALVEAARLDKKARDGLLTMVLPTGIGAVDLRQLSPEDLLAAWK